MPNNDVRVLPRKASNICEFSDSDEPPREAEHDKHDPEEFNFDDNSLSSENFTTR